MWKRTFQAILSFVVWTILLACILFAERLVRRHDATHALDRVDIELVGDTSHSFLSEQQIRDLVDKSGAATLGAPLNSVNLRGLKDSLEQHSVIKCAKVYLTHSGRLNVAVEQHVPLLRLRLDGYDAYVSREGFIFKAPSGQAMLTQVVTGSYVPPVPSAYVGYLSDGIADRVAELEEAIREEGLKFVDIVADKQRYEEMRKRPRRRDGESRSDYKQRLAEWNGLSDEMRRSRITYYAGMEHDADARYRAVEQRQEELRAEIKNLQKSYDDFVKLINFVESLSQDSFWGYEVTQIVIHKDSHGGMDVSLVPRSGTFRILFGSVDDVTAKMSRLERLYTKVLPTMGWDKYKIIDVKYKNQTICRR